MYDTHAKKAICAHEYELISVSTTDSLTCEKCIACGKLRQRDAAELSFEPDDAEPNTAA